MSSRKPKVLTSRKILVASVGVATVSYACSGTFTSEPGSSGGAAGTAQKTGGFTSGNLLPPPGGSGGSVATLTGGFTSGNLLPPPPISTGGQPSTDAGTDATKPLPTSGNLVPPPPVPSI
jgi:hypothetical protein